MTILCFLAFSYQQNVVLRYILSWQLQRMCNWWYLSDKLDFMEKYWYLVKLWAKMVLKIPIISYMVIRFLAIIQPFFACWTEILMWEIMILMLFWTNHTFGGKMGLAATLAPKGLGLLGQPLSQKLFSKICNNLDGN